MNNNIENNVVTQPQVKSAFGKTSLDKAAVIISITVGIAFALLVIKNYIGINMFLFSLIAISGVGYMLYKDDNLDVKNFIFFGGTFLVYASVFFRLEQGIYTVLTFFVLPFMIVITTLFSTKTGAKKDVVTFLYRMFGPVARVDKIFVGLTSLKRDEKKTNRKFNQVLLGVLISLGLLIIVIPLMISAEAAFKQFIDVIIKKIEWDFQIDKFIGKTIAGGVIAILFCGFLYTFTKDKFRGSNATDKAAVQKEDNHTLIITVLLIMGLVFLVFSIVQFNSLFVSEQVIIENTTFAKTAIEGYFQLVVLSVINFIMVLVCTKLQRGSNKVSRNIIKGLSTYFTLLNVYLLISSAYKMTLYYDAYGLSVERLLVYILLTFELIALILLLVKIYKSDMKFIKVMVYYAVAFWAVVSLINIEAWVVKVNVNRYEETGEIDMNYISWMSDDASGEIREFYFANFNNLSDDIKDEISVYYFENDLFRTIYNNKVNIDIYTIEGYEKAIKLDSWLKFSFSKIKKYNDGLEILQHYYETGYIETVISDN